MYVVLGNHIQSDSKPQLDIPDAIDISIVARTPLAKHAMLLSYPV